MKLFVGNLSYDITSDDLLLFFRQVGDVAVARVINDRETGRSKGFGFVEMSDGPTAERAIQEFNGVEALGRPLLVTVARDQRL